MNILETHYLSKKYGKLKALDKFSFSVEKGDIFGIIGHNGCGKTTLFKILCANIYQDGGMYSITDVWSDTPNIDKVRRKVGAVIENPALEFRKTCYQNLMFVAKLAGVPKKKEAINNVLINVGLYEKKKTKVKNLSLGMRQKLSIAAAIIKNPELLILDEPMNGLDPLAIVDMRNLLLRINKESGTTIVVSSHILTELENIVNKVVFMHKGKNIGFYEVANLKGQSLEQVYINLAEELKLDKEEGPKKEKKVKDNIDKKEKPLKETKDKPKTKEDEPVSQNVKGADE